MTFELDEIGTRNSRAGRLNALAQLISDDNVTLHCNFVHGEGEASLVDRQFRTTVSKELYAAYRNRAFSGLVKENSWILSVVVRPRVPFENFVRKFQREWLKGELSSNQECQRQITDIMQIVLIALERYGIKRLGKRTEDGWAYTEMGEALYRIMTGRRRKIPIANGHLGACIYVDPVSFGGYMGRHAYRIDTPDRPLVGMIFGYKEYPTFTEVGMLNELIGLDYPVVATHSFRFLARSAAQAKLQMKVIQMENSADKATSLLRDLIDMQDEVASNLVVAGSHHLSIAVYSDEPNDLPRRASDLAGKMSKCGAVVARETRGAFGAYYAQMPGCRDKYRTRPGVISSRNLSHMISLEGYPTGSDQGYWQDPVIEFITNGGTVYNYHPHVQDVGHTFIAGPTGSGKTLFISFLMSSLQPAMGDNGTILAFDKDSGIALSIHTNGGTYVALRRGVPSGLAPLLAYGHSEKNISHLLDLFTRLIMLDGKGALSPQETKRLRRGVARQLAMPRQLRAMGAIRAFMGFEQGGAGERFEKWCVGGSHGWLFDNKEDVVSVNARLVGFDFTELLPSEDRPDDGCALAAASDIMFRARDLMDGRRLAIVADECRFYIDAIPGILEDFALTGRKKELMLFLAAQKPDHLLKHPLGRSLLAQCPSAFLFPNETASWGEYGPAGLNCTPAEYRFVKESGGVARKRQVMLRRSGESVVLQFDLSGLDAEREILSSRADTVTLMDNIRGELGIEASPDDLADEFRRRYRSLPRIARRERKREEELV
jgi:type IV secretion system protein VirB4